MKEAENAGPFQSMFGALLKPQDFQSFGPDVSGIIYPSLFLSLWNLMFGFLF